jgi:hypothetical protein
MPKKNKEDIKTNDIIEIEEFSETSDNEEKSVVKPKKTRAKPDTKKKVKAESESEEESSEEEPPKKSKSKSKSKRVVESPVKKPISQKRLDALQRGREKAAKIRAEKKKLELDSIKKQLWEDFNGKVKDKKEVVEPSSKALEHISKMKSSLPQEPLKLGGNAVVRTFSKIK